MGYCSVLVSQDQSHIDVELPTWFMIKYKHKLTFIGGVSIASNGDQKFSNRLFEDYHEALLESTYFSKTDQPMIIATIGEGDGGIMSRVVITDEGVQYWDCRHVNEEKSIFSTYM